MECFFYVFHNVFFIIFTILFISSAYGLSHILGFIIKLIKNIFFILDSLLIRPHSVPCGSNFTTAAVECLLSLVKTPVVE